MTPRLVVLRRHVDQFDVGDALHVSRGWHMSIHWTQRVVYAEREGRQVAIPFESIALMEYTGETPRGPGRPEKQPRDDRGP